MADLEFLHTFQQYFSHIRLMGGWSQKALLSEALQVQQNLASNGTQPCDTKSIRLTTGPHGRITYEGYIHL